MTGGIGSAGEVVASNVAKTGAKIGLRVASGAIAGVGSKAVNEFKEIATTEKKFNEIIGSDEEGGDTESMDASDFFN